MTDVTTAAYVPNPQELPEYLSYSTFVVTDGNVVYTTESVVQLTQIYYGPSIPLGEGWSFGGSTSPASTPFTTSLPYPSTSTSITSSTFTTRSSSSSTSSTSSSPPSSLSTSALPAITASLTLSGTDSTGSSTATATTTPASSKSLPRSSLIPAILVPILCLFLILVGFLLWRKHKRRHTYGAVNTRSPAVGSEGTPDIGSHETDALRPGRLTDAPTSGWFPNLLVASGLRQRSTSARHGGRVPSTNLWGRAIDQGDVDDDFEMVEMPSMEAGGPATTTRDPDQTPRPSSEPSGRRGIDGTRDGDLGEILPSMGDVTPTRGHSSGKRKILAAIGLGLGRSPRNRAVVDVGESSPTTGRQPKLSQTDSSTPSSGQNFYPVGTAANSAAKNQNTSKHRKSESFPSVAGHDQDLFYAFPADDASRPGYADDSGVAGAPIAAKEPPSTSKKSRFSALFPEDLSSSGASGAGGSAASREPVRQLPRIHSQSSLERDLAELGMPIGLGAGLGINLDTLGTVGARTPTSVRSTTSQMRFPVPPERSREVSETGHGGVVVPIGRKATNETLDTRYHSLNDGVSILTRRSRQSTMSDDEGDNQYLTANAVDEHGRRVLPDINISSDVSHGISSAVRPSAPTRRPSEVLNSSTDEFDTFRSASFGVRSRPVPLSALPSPTYTENPSSAANRFSVLAGSITSLFGAKRASVASSSMGDEAVSPERTRRSELPGGNGPNRQSYAGQPLVGEDVYREALLSGHQAREVSDGLTPVLSRGTRQESSGETALSGNSRRALGLSSEEASGETFGVQGQRTGIRGRVVTPGNRAYEANRAASDVDMASTRVGEFGEVVNERQPNEVLKLPDDARKASALFFPNSPYSPAQASSQAASIQEASSKLSSNTPVGSFRSAGTHVSGDTQSSGASGESPGAVRGAQYSIAAVRGKRSMPRLVNTPDALAGLIPRTDTPPTGPLVAAEVPPPLPPKPSGGPLDLQNSDTKHDESSVLPPTPTAPTRPWVEAQRTGSPSSSSSEKRKEKEKWWLGRFGRS